MTTGLHPVRAGFSLVVSLIVLALLSVLVVGFLSSTALDRATAHAFLGKSQAELAADAAVNQAMSLLREHITEYPDSVTYWETLPAPTATASTTVPVEGTMLYFHDRPMPTGLDATPATAAVRYVLPLMSRGVDSNTGQLLGAMEVGKKAALMDTGAWIENDSRENGKVVNATAVDLNRRRFNGDTVGWIGSPPPPTSTGIQSPRPFRAKWIELKEKVDANGKSDTGKAPRTIGRYAFWVEDESFRANLNVLGNTARGAEPTETDEWQRARESPAKEVPPKQPLSLYPLQIASLPLQGLLASARAPVNREAVARDVKEMRDALIGKRVPDLRSFNQVNITTTANESYRLADETRFLASASSSALNLSRHGSQRLNLNALGFGSNLPTPEKNDPASVQDQIYQIIETIRYHAPKFGQRFYRLEPEITTDPVKEAARRNAEVVDPVHRNIYLHKIATNIRDYIDLDVKPTILEAPNPLPATVQEQATVRAKVWKPILTAMSADEGDNAIWAQGKDSAPFLQEVAVRHRGGPNKVGLPGDYPTRYTLKVDYYVEFWNMTGQDIRATDLGPGPFVRIANQIGWREQLNSGTGGRLKVDPATPGEPEAEREFLVYLTSGGPLKPILCNGVSVPEVIFRAGSCTVITTDPDSVGPPGGGAPPRGMSVLDTGGTYGPNTYYSANVVGKREFAGPLVGTRPIGILPIFGRLNGTSSSDYETEIILGTNEGQIDSHPFAVAMVSVAGLKTPASDDVYGGSLVGNTLSPSQLGDPRTNNEQLSIEGYLSGGFVGPNPEPDATRYANPSSKKPTFNLGWPNARFVNPPLAYTWKDYYKGWDSTEQAGVAEPQPNVPAAAAPATVANRALTSIGQLGDIFDPARTRGVKADGKTPIGSRGVVGARGGGRTLKIGQPDDLLDSTTVNAPSRAWAAWRLSDFFATTSDLAMPGAININGLARDNGAALRAACHGLIAQGVVRSPAKNSTFKIGTDWSLSTDEAASVGVPRVITRALERMKQNDPATPGYDAAKPYFGPFSERGELSELDTFNQGGTLFTEKSGGAIDMATAFDHTREQWLRRLIDMTTTRGSVFTVYAIGQAITEEPRTGLKRVTGTHQVKVTFQLVPKKEDGTDFGFGEAQQAFLPAQDLTALGKALKERFAAPHHYDIQILQVGS